MITKLQRIYGPDGAACFVLGSDEDILPSGKVKTKGNNSSTICCALVAQTKRRLDRPDLHFVS
jgi:hypothetical protein